MKKYIEIYNTKINDNIQIERRKVITSERISLHV